MTRWIFKLIAFIGAMFIGIVGPLFLNSQRPFTAPHELPVTPAEKALAAQTSVWNAELENEREDEIFSDDKSVGRSGKNKVVIRCYQEGEKSFAEITFYFLSNTQEWNLRVSSLIIVKDPIANCDPQISDFNNDGMGDVTFVSRTAGRGANELRTLLLYNKRHDSLDLIENAAEYPNLEYNKTLNCITAWAFHGATTTIFLRIEGRGLREFASVDTGAERVVTITRRNGQRVVLHREKMNEEDIYTRFTSFNPPQ